MGKVVKASGAPQPFPRIPVREPLQAQQPGEVLIRYEVEVAGGCQLSFFGWCCFGALLCTALPLSWVPFVCSECRKKYQRPVYGYPMHDMGFAAGPDAGGGASDKFANAAATAPPSIVCMDASLELQQLGQHPHQMQQQQQQQQELQQQQAAALDRRGDLRAGDAPAEGAAAAHPLRRSLPCSPSPPPMSIFVPPSAVPACGFTPDNPFPSRYSPVPLYMQQQQAALLGSPRPASPSPLSSPRVAGHCKAPPALALSALGSPHGHAVCPAVDDGGLGVTSPRAGAAPMPLGSPCGRFGGSSGLPLMGVGP